MGIAEIAIVVSIGSVLIAALSLGWNIYRDVVLKARVRVNFGVRTIVQHGNPDRPEYVDLSATNFGPGPVKLSMVQMKNSSWWRWMLRREQHAVLIHDYTNPLSGQLPEKLEVGECLDLLFPYDVDCMLKEGCSHIGVNDSFGRVHWAPKKQVKGALEKWISDYGSK